MKFKNLLPFIILLFSCLISFSQKTDSDKIIETFHSISSNEILGFAEELSSEKYKGRLSGSPEYLDIAKWCANKFKEWGVQPANNGSYFQYFPNEYSEVFSIGKLVYSPQGKKEINYSFLEDYLPGSNSASGTVTGEMVYVGYGITAPELNYDDYRNIDVKGKIIILEPRTPYTKNDSTLAKWASYAYHRYKFRNAVKHGAIGMIYVSKVANPNTVNLKNFIYAHVSNEVATQIIADAGKDYKTVKKDLKEMKTPSFALGPQQKITISAKTKYFPNAKSCNVVGLIEGSDPILKKEVIIIGGHLDGQGHMGVLFPGALDNASGASDILGAAKAFATSEIKPKRSVLFILIGGEECGLYGSKFYTNNPLFPIEKTTLMINLDMVGNGTGFYVGSGKSCPEIYKHFETANNNFIHRTMDASKTRKNYGRPRSDASNFENAGITTLELYTRKSIYPVHYHHPLDKTNVLTPEIMEDAAKLLYLGVLGVANDEGLKLKWNQHLPNH